MIGQVIQATMSLSPGTRLGHYAVTALIGEGGMGQVWEATDTQLGRQVALKILPDAFAADPDRLARFKREAQILASLNHPNIAAIYGIEESEPSPTERTSSGQEVRALVLELVEGPTLADHIAQGAMPIEDALPIARQIAEALEAAHEAGVIHRDLKPANIKVREDGTVKVLDFGLAKALDPNPEGDPSESRTLTAAATKMGVIMGTATYMAPEQAKGKVADKRADIWAFGVVLLEMLTGHRVFSGETVSETLAAVMMKEPEWDRLPADLPSKLSNLVRRCLEKDPRQRVRDIGDVRLAMEGAFETTVIAQSEPSVAPTLQLCSGRAQPLLRSHCSLVESSSVGACRAPARRRRPAPCGLPSACPPRTNWFRPVSRWFSRRMGRRSSTSPRAVVSSSCIAVVSTSRRQHLSRERKARFSGSFPLTEPGLGSPTPR